MVLRLQVCTYLYRHRNRNHGWITDLLDIENFRDFYIVRQLIKVACSTQSNVQYQCIKQCLPSWPRTVSKWAWVSSVKWLEIREWAFSCVWTVPYSTCIPYMYLLMLCTCRLHTFSYSQPTYCIAYVVISLLFVCLLNGRHVVLDEADQMLERGFADSVEEILAASFKEGECS